MAMANVKMYRAENNVQCNLVKSPSVKVVLVFFLLSILFEFISAEELQAVEEFECDFVKCVNGVRSFMLDLSKHTQTFNCKKLFNISWCSERCMHKYFPNAFSHPNEGQLSFTKYCEENISSRLNVNWSCIEKHIYRLFTCLVNVNSLTANNVREEVVTESCSSCLCRKYLEFPNCPKQILLADCGKESSDVVKDLILYVLDNYQTVSCKRANVKEVLSMPISYQLGSDFIDAAKSLDDHSLAVHNCLSQLIQHDNDLEDYMCGKYDPDVEGCVNYELLKTGKPHPSVNRLLFKTVALVGLKCNVSNFEPIPVSTLHSNKPEKIKPDDYHSLKDGTNSYSHEITTSKNSESGSDDLKLTSEFSTNAKTAAESKSEIPMKDSSYFNKNIKIVNVSDSLNKNSEKHKDQTVNPSNVSYRINLSINIIFFYCIFLLFIFR